MTAIWQATIFFFKCKNNNYHNIRRWQSINNDSNEKRVFECGCTVEWRLDKIKFTDCIAHSAKREVSTVDKVASMRSLLYQNWFEEVLVKKCNSAESQLHLDVYILGSIQKEEEWTGWDYLNPRPQLLSDLANLSFPFQRHWFCPSCRSDYAPVILTALSDS